MKKLIYNFNGFFLLILGRTLDMKRKFRYNFFLSFGALSVVLSLTGCASSTIAYYAPPADITPKNGASIIGSLVVDPNPLMANTHVFLMDVDNIPAHVGWKNWDRPTLVTPGSHLLTFGPCQCNDWAPNGPVGSITLAENFVAGETYILRSSLPKGGAFFTPITTTAWIDDGAGTAMSPPTTVHLQAAPAPVFVPVFIPTK